MAGLASTAAAARGSLPDRSAFIAFNRWTERYLRESARERAELLPEGQSFARHRRATLAALIRIDPAAAIAAAVPMAIRQQLPAEITDLLEERIAGRGRLALVAATPAPGRTLEEPMFRSVVIGRNEYRAYVYGRRTNQVSLSDASLIGIALDGRLALDESPLRLLESGEQAGSRPVKNSLGQVEAGLGHVALNSDATVLAVEYDGEIQLLESASAVAAAKGRLIAAEAEQTSRVIQSEGSSGGVRGRPFATWTHGPKKVLIIRVDFPDLPGAPTAADHPALTPERAVEVLSGPQGSSAFLAACSYGQTSLQVSPVVAGSSPDVTPVLRMPGTAEGYARGGYTFLLHQDAVALARAAGYNIDGYDRIGVVFSDLGGLAGSQIAFAGAANMMTREFWINGFYDFRVVTHEIGHTYGAYHANLWFVPNDNPVSTDGRSSEAADPYDLMGYFANTFDASFSHWNRNMLRWLPDDAVQAIVTSGTFRVYRFDTGLSADLGKVRTLKITRPDGRNYWIGYRRGTSNASLNGGAYVLWGYDYNQPGNLLDLAAPVNDTSAVALTVGATFNDAQWGISFKPVAQGGSGDDEWLDVQVDFQPRVEWSRTNWYVDKQAGSAELTVARAAGSSGPISVSYTTTAGTATAPAHFADRSGILSWTGGDTAPKTITIPIVKTAATPDPAGLGPVSHAPYAGSRAFTVTLTGVVGGVVGGNAATSVVIKEAGSVDPTVDFDFASSEVRKVVALPEGGYLAVGHFPQVTPGPYPASQSTPESSPTYRGGVARFTAAGKLDETLGGSGGAFHADGSLFIYDIVRQPDGRILVAGDFTVYNGVPHNGIVRLMSNGSIDPSFNCGSGPDGDVRAILLQPDGKIVLGGGFHNFAGSPRALIVRLNSDGTVDAGFNQPSFNGTGGGFVSSLARQSDGKILAAGAIFAGRLSSAVCRLQTTGDMDPSFDGVEYQSLFPIHKVLIQPDGRILIAGVEPTAEQTGRVFRLTANGARDASFTSGTFDGRAYALALQSDGMMIVGGDFSHFNGSVANNLARLTSTGNLDPSFSAGGGFDSQVYDVTIQGDGRIVLGGACGNCQDQPAISPIRVLMAGMGADPGLANPATSPTIITQPQGLTVGPGADVTFTVLATGNPAPTFQWRKNGTNLAGATDSSLRLPSVQAADAGAYSVAVTNSSGSVTSVDAVLVVSDTAPAPARITVDPQSQTVMVGSSVTFSVGVSGYPSPSYRWQKGEDYIPGAVSATYVISSAQFSDAGDYSVVVDNLWGTSRSHLAHLTVVNEAAPPVFTLQPVSQTATAGSSVTFTVAASGAPTPTFQWFHDGALVSGATSSSLVLTNLQPSDAGSYTARAANSAGTAVSSAATLTVVVANAPVITTQPQGQSVLVGSSVTFTVGASGTAPLTYQWRKNGANLTGATGSALSLTNIQLSDAAVYSVVVTNAAGSATSTGATLDVSDGAAPTFVRQPQSQTIPQGGSVTFTVEATGTPAPTLQWYLNGAPIPGATGTQLSLSGVQPGNAGTITVVATNIHGSATSKPAILTVSSNDAPTIIRQPEGHIVALGGCVVLSVSASGAISATSGELRASSYPATTGSTEGSFTYQWYKDGAPIAGAVFDKLMLAALSAGDSGNYSVVITSPAGSISSGSANLAVIVSADPGRLINASVRTVSAAGDQVLLVGFVCGGSGTAGSSQLLLRGVGPSLADFGVPSAMLDPVLDVISQGASTSLASNDDWAGSPAVTSLSNAVGAFALPITASHDAALVSNLGPGVYTAKISGKANTAGTVLAEIYDANLAGYSPTRPRLINLSARAQMSNDNPLIAGFVVGGTTAKTLLIRAVGPALAPYGITGAMTDPQLDLFRLGATVPLYSNDNWGGDELLAATGQRVGAFLLSDSGSKDAVLLVTLDPGVYSARVTSVNNLAGVALIEVYEVP